MNSSVLSDVKSSFFTRIEIHFQTISRIDNLCLTEVSLTKNKNMYVGQRKNSGASKYCTSFSENNLVIGLLFSIHQMINNYFDSLTAWIMV